MQFMHVYISLFGELTIDPIDTLLVNTLIVDFYFFVSADQIQANSGVYFFSLIDGHAQRHFQVDNR